jgi:hypothetical protein
LENAIQTNLQSVLGLRSRDALHGRVLVSSASGHKFRISETLEKIMINFQLHNDKKDSEEDEE